MQKYVPYVYFVCNRSTGLMYVGVRYARGCNPVDLWKTYFTSSKLVKKLIDEFGVDDFYIRVLKEFPNNPEGAILKEASFFPLLKKKPNYLNCCYSSGILDIRISSKAGKVGGSIVYKKQIGIFRDNEERKKWASLGGKVGGVKQRDEKLGIHGLSREEHLKNASKGGITAGVFQNKEMQSKFGKRGGPKNKGFVWLTDGKTSLKYTKKQQEEVSVEMFLSKNKNYKRGRSINA